MKETIKACAAKRHSSWCLMCFEEVCRAVAEAQSPVKVILMSTGLYTKPDSAEDVRVRNSCGQRALLCFAL